MRFDATWIWPDGSIEHGRMGGDEFWWADDHGPAKLHVPGLPAEEGFRWLRGRLDRDSPEVQAARARRIIGRSE